ncbi:Prefoldin subunit 2 [Phlyctochytrium bullatum]|nr:Prefoldin subunit 2 [Phlyctochytrium bullatum]
MSSSKEKRPSDQELVAQFNSMKQELQGIASKIGELEMERDEHKLVIETMEPLESSRKACRLVGGVLLERTVGEVLPEVKHNMDNVEKIQKLLMQLAQTFKKKEEDFIAFQVQKKYNIKIRDASEIGAK